MSPNRVRRVVRSKQVSCPEYRNPLQCVMVSPLARAVVVLLVSAVGVGCSPRCAFGGVPPRFEAATVPHGRLHQTRGYWVLELDGTAKQRGEAAGKLLGPQVRWLLPRYLRRVTGRLQIPAKYLERLHGIAKAIPPRHREQIDALAAAAKVDKDALLAANLATELKATLACSCLATLPSRSTDGKVRVARNLDWPAGDLFVGLGLVVIESGAHNRLASFTWPGLVGVVTGMNDAGLSVADLMAYPRRGGRVRPGVPVLFVVRSLLERAQTVDQALGLLRKTSRTMAQNYLLADAQGAVAVETGPKRFRKRKTRVGLAAITNYYDETKLIGSRRGQRYTAMFRIAGDKDALDVPKLKKVLREVALGDLNVQAAILVPEDRTVYLSTDARPAAAGPWVRLDLGRWLAKPNR